MLPVTILRHHAPRTLARLCPVIALTLCLIGCKRQNPNTGQIPLQHITVYAPQEMEPIIRAAEAVARNQERGWRIDLQTGGAQTLAWNIDAGDQPDLYIASTINMAETLAASPMRIEPWLYDQLVVVVRADDPDPILQGPRALERSTGLIAVGGTGTQLGDYARLAMRYAEIWPLVERRTSQRTNPEHMIEALRNGEVDLAILFASDAALGGSDVSISERLDLPEKAKVIYTRAIFSNPGAEFANLLQSPAALDQARKAGYTPIERDDEPTGDG